MCRRLTHVSFVLAIVILAFYLQHDFQVNDRIYHDVLLQRSKSSELIYKCVLNSIDPKFISHNQNDSQLRIGFGMVHQGSTDTVGLDSNTPIVITDYHFNRTNFLLEWKRVVPSVWFSVCSERYSYSNRDAHLRVRICLGGYLARFIDWLFEPFDSFYYWRLNSCIGR